MHNLIIASSSSIQLSTFFSTGFIFALSMISSAIEIEINIFQHG